MLICCCTMKKQLFSLFPLLRENKLIFEPTSLHVHFFLLNVTLLNRQNSKMLGSRGWNNLACGDALFEAESAGKKRRGEKRGFPGLGEKKANFELDEEKHKHGYFKWSTFQTAVVTKYQLSRGEREGAGMWRLTKKNQTAMELEWDKTRQWIVKILW